MQADAMHEVGMEEGSAGDTSDARSEDSDEHSSEGHPDDGSGSVGGRCAAGNRVDFGIDPGTGGISTDPKQFVGYGGNWTNGTRGDDYVRLLDEAVACGVRVGRSFAEVRSLLLASTPTAPTSGAAGCQCCQLDSAEVS